MPIPAIVLIALGLILLLAEIFIIPGFGIAGIPGIISIIVGVVWIWRVTTWQSGLIAAAITIIIIIPIAALAFWLLPKTKIGKTIILNTSERREAGFQASSEELEELVGKSGTAFSPLRPAGTAMIQGLRVDVVSQGEFIEKDSEIEVVKVEGNRVVVRDLSA